jgi:hypothetical protein
MFDTGKDHNLLATEGIDPNDIATLLKLYLRECMLSAKRNQGEFIGWKMVHWPFVVVSCS